MANTPGSIDLGLGGGGGDGDILRQQADETEEQRKKRMAMLGAGGPTRQDSANAMGGASINLLGAFRGY